MGDEIESPEVMSRKLLDAIIAAPNGNIKSAEVAGATMIKRRIRENGVFRSILPFNPVTNEDLNYLPNTELPVVIGEFENESPGAKSVSFNDGADTQFYRGEKFVVYFNTITTPEFTKNVDELRTYKSDLRQVVTDNALKDIHTEEDTRGFTTVDEIVGSVNGTGASGLQQNFEIEANITRESYVEALNHLEDRNLNNGTFVINRKTAKEFLKLGRDAIGGDLSERMFTDGLGALKEFKIFNTRHIATIKRDLVPDGVVYQFAEPGYLGRAYMLQDITMYVKKEEDMLYFKAKEKVGMTFVNVGAVNRCKYIGPQEE